MRSGKNLHDFIERARRGDKEMLAKVLSRPELTEEAEPYYAVFVAVSRDRPMLTGGMVAMPLPVPRDTIEKQCLRMGVQPDELSEFVEIVARIDDLFVQESAEKTLADLKKGKGKKG
jgi:hypothetical protein